MHHFLFAAGAALLLLLPAHAYAQTNQPPRVLGHPPVFDATRPRAARGAALDSTGWRFAAFPRVAALDEHSGEVRFRIQLTESGAIESVTPVLSTVSAAQEEACRAALLAAHFEPIGTKPSRATGYYTFRFSVR